MGLAIALIFECSMIALEAATPIVLKKEPMGCVPMLMTSGTFCWAFPLDGPKHTARHTKAERMMRNSANLFMVALLSILIYSIPFVRERLENQRMLKMFDMTPEFSYQKSFAVVKEIKFTSRLVRITIRCYPVKGIL
jgi:hypothetical protein